ncbi:hypothetical protein COU74_02140 [Candidatus Peregrinibacteria bacterium CG10_big_fil_rev_8_21_14_0_10_36_19]|nr:MAG: hypothetical protein COU74_02140 [Candidatus Peregrinibacteria bacterium CG10_big_fil_rev_8_21_14_0_10_36_19]
MFKKFLAKLALVAVIMTSVANVSFAADPFEVKEFKAVSSLDTASTIIDPSPKGKNEDLLIKVLLDKSAGILRVNIKNDKSRLLQTLSFDGKSEINYIWNPINDSQILEPGIYTAELLMRENSSSTEITKSINFEVRYQDSSKPDFSNFLVSKNSFDPDTEDLTIKFRNNNSANLVAEVRRENGDVAKTFSQFSGQGFGTGDREIVWDGRKNDGHKAEEGKYLITVVGRNDYGSSKLVSQVTVDNSGGVVTTSNTHISGITIKPSGTFKPENDEEIEIEFDVVTDLDELVINAKRGSVVYEIQNYGSIDKENNVTEMWNGEIDDGYALPGTWTIEFKSKKGTVSLTASKTVEIEYDKPSIDEFLLSKNEFDTDLDEVNTVLFVLDDNATVTIEIIENGKVEDTIVEEWDVERGKWYAFEWDGNGYDPGDDIDLRLKAANLVNEDVFNTKTINVNLREDSTSSNRSNVTNDYISPGATDGYEDMTIFYTIDQDADVSVTILKGDRSSGSKIVQLMDGKSQSEGSHSIVWNGRDGSGNKLANGFYTYKIESKYKGTDTEYGIFVVGKVGEADKTTTSSTKNVKKNDGKVNSNVIVDGQKIDRNTVSEDKCGGYADINETDNSCDYITWVTDNGIFKGYSDNTFRPYQTINRVEALKVIIEAVGLSSYGSNNENPNGFKDIKLGQWYVNYINTAKNLGIFNGDGNAKTARPSDTVSRIEALKLIFETLRVKKGMQLNNCSQSYNDVAAGAWYNKYACSAKTYQLYNTSILQPESLITRGEVAELLYELRDFVK